MLEALLKVEAIAQTAIDGSRDLPWATAYMIEKFREIQEEVAVYLHETGQINAKLKTS